MGEVGTLKKSASYIVFRDYWSRMAFLLMFSLWAFNLFYNARRESDPAPDADFSRFLLEAAVVVSLAVLPVILFRIIRVRGILIRGEIVGGRVIDKRVFVRRDLFPAFLKCQYEREGLVHSGISMSGGEIGDFGVGKDVELVVDRAHPKRALLLSMYLNGDRKPRTVEQGEMGSAPGLKISWFRIALRDYWSNYAMGLAPFCWGIYLFAQIYVRVRHMIPNLIFARDLFVVAVIATLAAALIASLRVSWIRGILARGEIVIGRVMGKIVPTGARFISPSLRIQYLYDYQPYSKTRSVGRLVHEFEPGDELEIVVDREHPGRSLILAVFQRSGDKSRDSAKA